MKQIAVRGAERLKKILSHQRQSSSAIRAALRQRQKAGLPVLCNLGCGVRHHPAWLNIDHNGDGRDVLAWDLQAGLPLPDACCDAVYASHVIEHFDRGGARRFLAECNRIMKPGAIVRLVVPDLEGIARTYLRCLEAVERGEVGSAERYDWITLELIDQLVRHQSGGEMLKLWSREEVPAEDFIAQRVGTEYRRARKHLRGRRISEMPRKDPTAVGRFRLGGEVHQWMYDRYSLGRLFAESGFAEIQVRGAAESSIDGFASYGLDTEPDGTVYKPDSLFMEGAKSRESPVNPELQSRQ